MTSTFRVQVAELALGGTDLGPDAPERPGADMTGFAAAVLGDEAWNLRTVEVEAESHERARELVELNTDARAQILSVTRVPDWTLPAQILDVTPDEYHADPCPEPSISASVAKTLWARSPQHAWLEHPRGGAEPWDPTDKMDRGTIAHALLLGEGKSWAVVDAKDWRTDAAKAARAAARKAGKVAVLKNKLAEVREAVEAWRGQLDAHGLALDGQSEVPIAWRERVHCSDVTVWARTMIDHVCHDRVRGRLRVIELKTTESAHPDAVANTVANLGYDIQQAANTRALEALIPEMAGRIDYVFLFAELEAPYTIAPYRLDGEFRSLGEKKWDRCVKQWHQCLRTNTWPGYLDGIGYLSAPRYAVLRAQDAGIEIEVSP